MFTRRLTGAAVASVAILVATGCSDDGGSTSGDESPLEAYLGEDAVSFAGSEMSVSFGGRGGEPYEPTEEELQQQREVEEHVASCMAEQGFEYVPNVVSPDDFTSPFEEAYSLPPDEFAEQYGYGISTLRPEDIDMPEDPNEEIRDSLSPEAREAYEEALFGDMRGAVTAEATPPARGTPTPPPVEERGCYAQASAEVFDIDEEEMFAGPSSEFDGLMEDLFRMSRRLDDDPRVVEATEQWRGCMADAGYPDFERVGDPEQSVFQRMNELQGFGPPTEAPVPGEQSGEGAAGEGGESGGSRVFEPQEIDPEDLEELQEYELALARADFGCREEHYNDIAEEVQYELEEEFVEDHRAELERFRDQMAERQRGPGNADDDGEDESDG